MNTGGAGTIENELLGALQSLAKSIEASTVQTMQLKMAFDEMKETFVDMKKEFQKLTGGYGEVPLWLKKLCLRNIDRSAQSPVKEGAQVITTSSSSRQTKQTFLPLSNTSFSTPEKTAPLQLQNTFIKIKKDETETQEEQWLSEAGFIYKRNCYDVIYTTLMKTIKEEGQVNCILEGKSGTGKSLFLVWLINQIFDDADDELPSPTIIYVFRREENAYLLQRNEDPIRIVINQGYRAADYLLVDNVDVDPSKIHCKFRLAATSTNDCLKAFRTWAIRHGESKQFMLNFSYQECVTAFLPKETQEELKHLQFRYDIFGGNPRLMNAKGNIPNSSTASVTDLVTTVRECMDEYLEGTTWSGREWAVGVISSYAMRQNTAADVTYSSLFVKHHFDEEEKVIKETCSSTLMGMIANRIIEKKQTTMVGLLESIFARTGRGYCTEFVATKVFLAQHGSSICLFDEANSKIYRLELPKFTKRLIRNLHDLLSLLKGEYGMPTITNYPIIDGIFICGFILFLVQVTIGEKHKTAKTQFPTMMENLKQLRESLGLTKIVIIWVLDDDNIKSFQPDKIFADNNITSYKAYFEKCSEAQFAFKIGKKISSTIETFNCNQLSSKHRLDTTEAGPSAKQSRQEEKNSWCSDDDIDLQANVPAIVTQPRGVPAIVTQPSDAPKTKKRKK